MTVLQRFLPLLLISIAATTGSVLGSLTDKSWEPTYSFPSRNFSGPVGLSKDGTFLIVSSSNQLSWDASGHDVEDMYEKSPNQVIKLPTGFYTQNVTGVVITRFIHIYFSPPYNYSDTLRHSQPFNIAQELRKTRSVAFSFGCSPTSCVYVLNTKSGIYQLASILPGNKHTRNGRSTNYFLTDDGSGVFFDWETGDEAGGSRASSGVYFRNLVSKQTIVVSPTVQVLSSDNSTRYTACGMSADGKYTAFRSRARAVRGEKYSDSIFIARLDDSRARVVGFINPLVDVAGNTHDSAPLIECEAGDNILSADGRFVVLTTNERLNSTTYQKWTHWLDVYIRDLSEGQTMSISDNSFRKDDFLHDCHSAGMSRNGKFVGYFCTYLGSSQNLYLATVGDETTTSKLIHDKQPLIGTDDPSIGVDSVSDDGSIILFSTGIHTAVGLPSLAPGAANPYQVHTYVYNASNTAQHFNLALAHYSNDASGSLQHPSKSAVMTSDASIIVVLSSDALVARRNTANDSNIVIPYILETTTKKFRSTGLPNKFFSADLDNERVQYQISDDKTSFGEDLKYHPTISQSGNAVAFVSSSKTLSGSTMHQGGVPFVRFSDDNRIVPLLTRGSFSPLVEGVNSRVLLSSDASKAFYTLSDNVGSRCIHVTDVESQLTWLTSESTKSTSSCLPVRDTFSTSSDGQNIAYVDAKSGDLKVAAVPTALSDFANASRLAVTKAILVAIDSKHGSEFTSPVLSSSGNCIVWKRISEDGDSELSLSLLAPDLREAGAIHRADVAADGREANAGPYIEPDLFPTIGVSSNCQHLVWISEASNLVANSKAGRQIFWRDRLSQTVTRVPVGPNDELVPSSVQVSFDGRYVSYTTEDNRMFLYDTTSKKLEVVFDNVANDAVYSVSAVSSSNTFVVTSHATSLYSFDANASPDVFVCSVSSPSCIIASVLADFYATRFIGAAPSIVPSLETDQSVWRLGGPLFWGALSTTTLFVLGIIVAGLLLKCGFFQKRDSASDQGYSLVSNVSDAEETVSIEPRSSSRHSRKRLSFSSDSKEKVN